MNNGFMKLYLDTNIIYGFFREIVESYGIRRYRIPSVIEFFRNKRFKIFSSILVKCEIARRLRLDYNLSSKDIEGLWNFLERYINMKVVDRITLDSELLEIIKRNKFRSRINNLIHLYLCKELELILITGDNKMIEDGKGEYKNIMSYTELRSKY